VCTMRDSLLSLGGWEGGNIWEGVIDCGGSDSSV